MYGLVLILFALEIFCDFIYYVDTIVHKLYLMVNKKVYPIKAKSNLLTLTFQGASQSIEPCTALEVTSIIRVLLFV